MSVNLTNTVGQWGAFDNRNLPTRDHFSIDFYNSQKVLGKYWCQLKHWYFYL